MVKSKSVPLDKVPVMIALIRASNLIEVVINLQQIILCLASKDLKHKEAMWEEECLLVDNSRDHLDKTCLQEICRLEDKEEIDLQEMLHLAAI